MSSFSLGFSPRFSVSMLGGVMLGHPLTITAAGHIADPVLVFQIPADGFMDAALKRLQRAPVQFALALARVHRVPPVVAGAGFDERDQLTVWNGGVVRAQFVEQTANRGDNVQVLFFAAPTDVVGFANT